MAEPEPTDQRRASEPWLVVGGAGMLGGELTRQLRDLDEPVTAVDLPELDITDVAACHRLIDRPMVVVNCAAYTAVDAAESDEARAFTVNSVGPANLARACAKADAHMIHVSTDYVFSGDSTEPYAEDAAMDPRTAYGRTKAAGEWAVRAYLPQDHLVVRTAWLYGGTGPSFVHTMRRLALDSEDQVSVVADQQGQPTWTRDVARRAIELGQRRAIGTVHATGGGQTTWFDAAREVFRLVGADPDRVKAVTSDEYRRPAPRPMWSVLADRTAAGLGASPIGDWRERLAAFAATGFGQD